MSRNRKHVVAVADGPALLNTTFSNNPKTNTEGSYQDYPVTNSPPRSGVLSTNTLGYSGFFREGICRFHFAFLTPGAT